MLAGNFRRLLNAELQLSTFLEDLAAADTSDQCWEVLENSYSQFGFTEIRFKLGGRLYTHTTNGHRIANTWTIRIQLSMKDYLNLSREFDTQAPPIVAGYTDAIGKMFRAKTCEMLWTDPIHTEIAIAVGARTISRRAQLVHRDCLKMCWQRWARKRGESCDLLPRRKPSIFQ